MKSGKENLGLSFSRSEAALHGMKMGGRLIFTRRHEGTKARKGKQRGPISLPYPEFKSPICPPIFLSWLPDFLMKFQAGNSEKLASKIELISQFFVFPSCLRAFVPSCEHLLGSRFQACEAGASRTLAFPGWSLGTRGKYRRKNPQITQIFADCMKPLALSLLVLLPLLNACSPKGKAPLPSPDGSMTLWTTGESSRSDPTAYGCVIVEVRDKSAKLLHRENSHASSFQKWEITWISNNEFQLKSSDIGAVSWKLQADKAWKKQ